ncbi:MAG TPA: TonB family protein [Gemmatimonadales bacterium]|nr:TonB family protein [Gemmatimonadales bacterium]
MRCSRCGSDVPTSSRFCSSCGFDLAVTTPVRALATGEITDFDLVREALANEYEVLEELGRGGMAFVYRARDRQLERQVAIKVLPFTFAFDAEFVERFQREARTSAQLEHPNIIPIFRVGQTGRVIYFVMKYLRGGSLASALADRRTLSPPEIRRILIEAGRALGYAARQGVVHRDIKPDNIMFDEFGQSVLTDFGIAKAASGQRLTGTGMSIGTPHYMSPEQARAQATDGRSDLYSLGVVAYQCLTGRVPYDGEDSFSIGYKHITEPIPTPMLASIDERRLFEVIRRMLAKEPGDRFQDCDELVTALQADPVAAPGPLRLRGAAQAALAETIAAPAIDVPSAPSLERTTPVRVTPVPATPARTTPVRAYPQRRVAHRSEAMKAQDRPLWPWVLVLLVLAGGATAWSHFGNPLAASPNAPEPAATAPAVSDDSAADAAVPAPAPLASSESAPAQPTPRPVPPPGAAEPAVSRGTGGLRVRGIPRGSIVQIDQQAPSSAISLLPAGRHEIAISAPLHHFFLDTVEVVADDTLDFEPALVPTSTRAPRRAPAGSRIAGPAARRAADSGPCEPGAAYDASQCFDARPRPAVAPFIPVPAGAAVPEQGTLVWVQVSAEGRTETVRARRSSGSREFDQAAVTFVQQLSWSPATRVGAPVSAWVPLEVRPAPQ